MSLFALLSGRLFCRLLVCFQDQRNIERDWERHACARAGLIPSVKQRDNNICRHLFERRAAGPYIIRAAGPVPGSRRPRAPRNYGTMPCLKMLRNGKTRASRCRCKTMRADGEKTLKSANSCAFLAANVFANCKFQTESDNY